ncbi:MAG TPA: hypothetical protein PL010_15375 [Flavobacteriales bacterium]|nr:hypothetical protein [Flavobacteriales bacterium]HNI06005.1 hypothetical protein [Flavobacteriales bacterium]
MQHAPQRPAGNVFTWNGNQEAPDHTPTAAGITDQTAAQSGKDWLMDHTTVTDLEGNVTGIVGVGYSFPQNWSYTNGCVVGSIGGFPDPLLQETHARRLGSVRQVVCYYNASGILQWCKFLGAGVAHGVIVDREGYIVVTGQGYNQYPFPETPGLASLFNPAPGYTQPMDGFPCPSEDQMTLAKLDLSGNVVWSHFYNTQDDLNVASTERCQGQSLVETNAGGVTGYRIVGWQRDVDNLGIQINQRPCLFQVDGNGLIQFKHRYPMIPGADSSPSSNDQMRAMYISRCPFSVGERFAVTGYRTVDVTGIGTRTSAWLMYMDDAIGTVLDAEWTKDVFTDNAYFGADLAFNNNANRVAVTMDGNTPCVAWPVMLNFQRRGSAGAPLVNADITASSANREATARLYKFNGTGGAPMWTVNPDLGPVRALDLFYSVKQRNSGNLVVASTKLSPGFSIDNPLDYADMPTDVQNCLTSPTGLGYDPDGSGTLYAPTPWSTTTDFNYWGHLGTDSWTAIVSHTNGSRIWDYQWDEDDGANSDDCLEDNWRQRQCDFQVTTDPAGDIIVCGNAGRNMDDFYLAKIQPSCDAKADYAIFEAMYPNLGADNNEVHITTAVVWNQSMNVRGSIIIDPGGSLNITGANTVIRFADSRKMGYTCNIVVNPASTINGTNSGKLVINEATLTSLDECPESMWDGIRILGWNYNDALNSVGYARIVNGGTISNAVVAATNCQVDPMDPSMAAATQVGGVIRCDDAYFLRNRFDVVCRPYGFNGGPESPSNCRFINTAFETPGLLNYPNEYPETHLWLEGARRTHVQSCRFGNTYNFAGVPPELWGVGIRSINTSLSVREEFEGAGWGSFTGLERGIHYEITSTHTCLIRNNLFDRCAGGVRLNNTTNAVLDENEFVVPDALTTGTGFPWAYGFGIWGGSGFTIENNHVRGDGPIALNPVTIGAIFDNTGNITDQTNEYANNTFDQLTYGTFIQQVNDGPGPDDGLHLKCNDYGTGYPNSQNFRDIAFTGPTPRVGDKQGAPYDGINQQLLAGNTFTLCDESDLLTNMVEDIADVNMFTYWHHAPTPGFNLNAHCRLPGLANFQPDVLLYNKEEACGQFMMAMVGGGGGQASRMQQAQEEYALVRTVYDSQRDGGNTASLKEYVYDPAHSSSEVRNTLMLAAPKVSIETWAEVFKREAPLNPWHMAQALLANSPLQPEVVRMMEESELTPYYKQLVLGGQGDGINSQTILESEMSHWKHEHAEALKRLVAEALEAETTEAIDAALTVEAQYPEMGTPWSRIHLLIAKGDLAGAKAIVDELNAVAEPEGAMEVLGMSLDLEMDGTPLADAPPAMLERLQYLADNEGTGMFAAQSWLHLLQPDAYPERILLPVDTRSSFAGPVDGDPVATDEVISVYPNPAKDQAAVYVVVKLHEGMEKGTVQVFDPIGRLVHTEQVASSTAIVEVPVQGFVPGLYLVALDGEGLRIGTGKFELTR